MAVYRCNLAQSPHLLDDHPIVFYDICLSMLHSFRFRFAECSWKFVSLSSLPCPQTQSHNHHISAPIMHVARSTFNTTSHLLDGWCCVRTCPACIDKHKHTYPGSRQRQQSIYTWPKCNHHPSLFTQCRSFGVWLTNDGRNFSWESIMYSEANVTCFWEISVCKLVQIGKKARRLQDEDDFFSH